MRIETSLSSLVTSPFAGAVGVAREGTMESAKADVPWWEADLSGLAESDTTDVSIWQEAQVEAWTRAV